MTIPIGRKGQVFLKKEAVYGTEEVLAAANSMRHIECIFGANPFNRETSPEKKTSPGPANRFDRKKTAELGSLIVEMRGSGVLNTLPEIDPLLECGFGASNNVTLDTDVASSPVVGGATLTSGAGLAVGDAVLLSVTGEAKSPFVRILQTVAGADVTWAPDLPSAQTVADAVKGGITYKLSTDLALSLTIAHYLGGALFKKELLGAGINDMTMAFEANEEIRLTCGGPAQSKLTGTTQAQPTPFTTVGPNPPNGLIGDLLIGTAGTEYLIKSFEMSLANGLIVRDQEYGVNGATEVYRDGRREITFGMNAFAETEATVYDPAEAGTNLMMLLQTGRTEGNIIALFAPEVEWQVPEQDDPDEGVSWDFTGTAIETVDGANDELTLAIM